MRGAEAQQVFKASFARLSADERAQPRSLLERVNDDGLPSSR
jgi:hypothetical protein